MDPLVELHKPFGLTDYVALELNAEVTLSDSGTITAQRQVKERSTMSNTDSVTVLCARQSRAQQTAPRILSHDGEWVLHQSIFRVQLRSHRRTKLRCRMLRKHLVLNHRVFALRMVDSPSTAGTHQHSVASVQQQQHTAARRNVNSRNAHRRNAHRKPSYPILNHQPTARSPPAEPYHSSAIRSAVQAVVLNNHHVVHHRKRSKHLLRHGALCSGGLDRRRCKNNWNRTRRWTKCRKALSVMPPLIAPSTHEPAARSTSVTLRLHCGAASGT